MRILLLSLLVTGTLSWAPAAQAQARMILVAKSGTKCLTAQGNRLVGAACIGDANQTLTPNFAVGGLQLGTACFRRNDLDLTLAACRAGDAAEVFEVSSASNEIASRTGARACVDLAGAPSSWRPNQPVTLALCNGSVSQKWLVAALAPTASSAGTLHRDDTAGELRAGDSVALPNGQFLVVK